MDSVEKWIYASSIFEMYRLVKRNRSFRTGKGELRKDKDFLVVFWSR